MDFSGISLFDYGTMLELDKDTDFACKYVGNTSTSIRLYMFYKIYLERE